MAPGEIPRLSGTPNSQRGAKDEVDATLRWLARLPAPEGLEDRVIGRVAAAPRGGRLICWPRRHDRHAWMRNAAAAAIVFVVLGGGWGVYSRVERSEAANGTAAPAPAQPARGFASAGAVRRPETIPGPMVAAPGKAAASPRTAARAHHRAEAARHGKKTAGKPAAGPVQ